MLNNISGAARPLLPMQPSPAAPAAPNAAPAAPTTDGPPTPNAIIHETVVNPAQEVVSQAVPDVGQVLRSGLSEGLKGLTDVAANVQELAQSAFGTGPEGILNNLSSMASQFIQNPTAMINQAIDQDGKSSNIVDQIGNLMQQGASAIHDSDFGQALGSLPELAGRGVEQGIAAIENVFRPGQNTITHGGADLSGINPTQAASQAHRPENTQSAGDAHAIHATPEAAPLPQAPPMPAARPETQVEDTIGSVTQGLQAVTGSALSAPVEAIQTLSEGPLGEAASNLAAQANAGVQGALQAAIQGNPVQAVMQTFEAARPKGI